MRILVLNGSPKKEKSNTMHITRAFLDGMRDAAAQKIHVTLLTIISAFYRRADARTEKNRFWKSNIRGTSRTMTN